MIRGNFRHRPLSGSDDQGGESDVTTVRFDSVSKDAKLCHA